VLATGDITMAGFWSVHLASALTLLLVCLFLGLWAALAAVVLLAVNYAYSLRPMRLTKRPLLSPLVLALAYVYFPFSLGFWSSGSGSAYPWLLTLGLLFGFIARMLLKDFRDRPGDQRHGKTTFLLRYGVTATIRVSAAAWALAAFTIGLATGSPALSATLAFGAAMVILWLRRLAKARTRAAQEDIIKAIAIAGNWAIVATMVFYLCRALGLDTLTTQVLPAVLAAGAFAIDFIHHYIEAGHAKLLIDDHK
jgi:4-hydroxybenzoate polyprenyltransferase